MDVICSCCNRPVDPEFAKDHSYCPVCWSARCTALSANHDESKLKEHYGEESAISQ